MQKALEIAPGIAVMEAAFFLIFLSRNWFMLRRGFDGEPFDDGPWWSVAFFRVWAACHMPVLLFQMAFHVILKKQTFQVSMPLLLAAFLLHAVNFTLIVLLYSVYSPAGRT